MKLALWVIGGLGSATLAFWIVVSPWFPKSQFVLAIVMVYLSLPSVGAFWMLYMVVRHERKPLGLVLLAFVPYSFLWYYTERVRSGKATPRQTT